MDERLRALVVSYAFPPVGGGGVQRSVKLVKFLPELGIDPAVLTVRNASAPLHDHTFDRDFPPGMEIVRARTLEPGYGVKQATLAYREDEELPLRARLKGKTMHAAKQLLVPDAQVLWLPGAESALARRLWGPRPDDVVFITSPPFSQFWLAPLARLKPGTAVVLDYRDEWSTLRAAYGILQAQISTVMDQVMETRLVRSAHAITTATEEFRNNLLNRFSFLDPERVVAIPNGYDPDDFPSPLPSPPQDRFVISYAGTIFKLTGARGLLGAVRLLHERAPELAKLLHVRFMGRIVESEKPWFDGMDRFGVETVGYVPHERVLEELGRSHMTLCLLDEAEGVERVYPAKIFELMNLDRPVLTLAPEGALTRLVRELRLGPVLAPREEEEIARFLEERLVAFRDGRVRPAAPPEIDAEGVARYHRRQLCGRFAEVMRNAVERARA